MRLALAFTTCAALAACALAACGDDAADPGLGPVTCDPPQGPPVVTDPCADRTCFDACGTAIALDAAPLTTGLTAAAVPAVRPHAARRIGFTVATAVPSGLQIRQGDAAAVVGALPLPGTPTTLADAGGVLFAATAANTLYPINTNDPTAPVAIATWRPTAPVELIAADNDRLVLRTPSGVSLIDVTDLTAPVEAHCFEVPAAGGMDRVWDVAANRFFVVAAGGDTPRAFVYDLQRPAQPPAPLPIDADTSVTLYDGAALVTLGGELVEYALTPGQPIAERRRADLPSAAFRPPVVGGFALYGDVALDLTTDLALYDVIDTGGPSCTLSLNARDLSDAWVISPSVVPDRRYAPDDFPTFDCGPRVVRYASARAGAHEPGGPRLLIAHDDGLSLLDGDSGARVDDLPIAGEPAWVAGHLVGVDAPPAPGGAVVTWVAADAPTTDPGRLELDRPLVAWTYDADHLWLILEPEPRAVGADAPPASAHALARVTPPSAELVAVPLPDGAEAVGLAAAPGLLWVFDARRRVHALDADGAAALTVDADRDADPTTAIASTLGLFFVDACDAGTWVSPSGELRRQEATATPSWRAAGATAVYAAGDDRPHPELAGAPLLLGLTPTPGADGRFDFTRAARASLPSGDPAVVPGAPLAVLLDGVFLFATP